MVRAGTTGIYIEFDSRGTGELGYHYTLFDDEGSGALAGLGDRENPLLEGSWRLRDDPH